MGRSTNTVSSHIGPWITFGDHSPLHMNHTLLSCAVALAITGLAACSGSEQHQPSPPDMTGWVPQAALDSVRADNRRLVNELAYANFRLEECGGPSAALLKAQYHAERGEHTAAKPHLEKVKAHGPEHARKAEVVEKAMTAPSEAKMTPAKDDNIISEADAEHGVTWYYDRRVPRDLDTTTFYLYMGHKATGAPWLRMRSQYAGDRWLFVHTIRISSGNLKFERRPDPALMFSKAGDLTVTEWNDTPPSHEDLRVIRQIVGSTDAEITFLGHKGEYSRKLTDSERESFINVLRYYELSGKVDEARTM